jgi:hypothetical protein
MQRLPSFGSIIFFDSTPLAKTERQLAGTLRAEAGTAMHAQPNAHHKMVNVGAAASLEAGTPIRKVQRGLN